MGWQYKKKITISGSSGAGEGYQVLLKIGESSGAENYDFHLEGHSAKFPSNKDDGGDLIFTLADEETLLSFWIEKVEGTYPNRTAYVWVKIYDNLDNDVDIWIFYGNSEASNASNGRKTFEFFDDFENDDGIWTLFGQNSNKSYEINNNVLHLPILSSNAGGLDEGVYVQQTVETNMVVKTRMKINKTGTVGATGFYFSKNAPPGIDGYLIFGATDNGKFGMTDWNFDTSGVIEYNEFTADYNSWHIWEIRKKGNEYTLFYDGENKGSLTRTNTPQDYLIFGVPYSNNELWSDFIFARKYIDPEPSFYSTGTEEDAGNVGFEFTYLYVDKFTVSSGFTVLESAYTLVSSGFYMLMSSFLNSELSIETCRVRNKDKYSVTLVGRIVDTGGNSSVNVYFEYWRKDNPANIISTPVQTITTFTQPAYVFQDINGLDEITDYEYKAIVYVDENDKKEGGIVPFTTAGVRYLDFQENCIIEETNNNLFLNEFEEEINTNDSYRLWDIWSVKEYEDVTLNDEAKYKYMFSYEENVKVKDNYFNLFLSAYEETTGFFETKRYKEPYPTNWIITLPCNSNFSFEKDTDSDGIADGWNYENLVLTECYIKSKGIKPTVQYIKFDKNGRFYYNLDIETNKIVICMDLAVEGNVNFKVCDRNTGKIFYNKKYNQRSFITEIIKFTINSPLVFEFSGTDSSLYIDNFVILTEEKFKKDLIGFSVFGYNIEGDNTDISFKRQYIQKQVKKKEFNLLWNWLTMKQFDKIKEMKGKKIYVKTPLEESFAFYVEGIDVVESKVLPNQEWEQKYQVKLNVKEV